MTKTFKVPAIILAGGLGTRLRSVSRELPKPMIEVLEKPFLYWLIVSLEKLNFETFIFSIGYKAEYIQNYNWSEMFPKSKFEFVTEKEPLGTGGAVKNIFDLQSNLKSAWVVNGDTILEKPLPPEEPSEDEVLYTVLNSKEIYDAKPNLIAKGDRVMDVQDGHGSFFDGGQVYVTRKAVDSYTGPMPCSFHQLIQKSLSNHKVGFIETPGTCYDIGTPERLKRFENYLKSFVIDR